jgi:hypothetical protein
MSQQCKFNTDKNYVFPLHRDDMQIDCVLSCNSCEGNRSHTVLQTAIDFKFLSVCTEAHSYFQSRHTLQLAVLENRKNKKKD